MVPQRQGGRLLPRLTDAEKKLADEEAEAVMAYARSREGRLESQREVQEALRDLPQEAPPASLAIAEAPGEVPQALPGSLVVSAAPGQVSQALPGSHAVSAAPGGVPQAFPEGPLQVPQAVLEQAAASNTGLLASPPSPRMAMARDDAPAGGEPIAKRGKTSEASLRRVEMVERRLVEVEINEDKLYHLDEVINHDFVNAWMEEEAEKDEKDVLQKSLEREILWSDEPLGRTPSQPTAEVDAMANKVEIERLQSMGVLAQLGEHEVNLDSLTTRMVYDWRIKGYENPATGEKKRWWMRRARLVAREYAHEKRDDVHSPASGGQALRILPIVYLMMRAVDKISQEELMIGALDIGDAFLQVKQERPLQVATPEGKFKVERNLPGQRIGAKAWFSHLTSLLREKQFEFSKENPCLGKRRGGVYILIHVDDVMFCGVKDEVQKLVDELKAQFKVSVSTAQYDGDKFEFLKRTYELNNNGISIMPGRYSDSMIQTFEEFYGQVKLYHTPCSEEAQDIGQSGELPWKEASLFRSVVGSGIYLSMERVEIAYTIKQLAGGMANPTHAHLQVMRRLIGYLKFTKGYYSHLSFPAYGKGIHNNYSEKWVLESFTDSDWSGDRKSRRSTSSAAHSVNGMICYHSSRGQKVVSLSSAEAELHGLVGGAVDGIFIRRCLEFLVEQPIFHACLIDNSATRQISNKQGTGKLRHVSGKLLWVQDQTASKELVVKQVGTVYNISDINTKPMSRARLQVLLYWCGVRDGNGDPVGEEEVFKLKENQVNKAKIMRIAKMLYTVVAFGGLEQATAEKIPFRFDLEPVEPPSFLWISMWSAVLIAVVFILVVVFMVYILKKFNALTNQVTVLKQELEDYKAEVRREMQTRENELDMQHLHVSAMHVGMIRMGGWIDISENISEHDWDNWNYMEKNNQQLEVHKCRRALRRLRRRHVQLQDRRRHSTPTRSQAHGSESEPESEETSDGRYRRYQQSTMSEVSDPEYWMGLHYPPEERPNPQAQEDRLNRRSRSRTTSRRSNRIPQDGDDSEASSEDTLFEDYMGSEYLEWPNVDWRNSFERAQLDALEMISDLGRRARRAEEGGNENFAQWIGSRIQPHRQYQNAGTLIRVTD